MARHRTLLDIATEKRDTPAPNRLAYNEYRQFLCVLPPSTDRFHNSTDLREKRTFARIYAEKFVDKESFWGDYGMIFLYCATLFDAVPQHSSALFSRAGWAELSTPGDTE